MRDEAALFVNALEAAFIAELTESQLRRINNERIFPEILIRTADGLTRFSRLACAMARFYFAAENELTPEFRYQVISELADRAQRRKDASDLLALCATTVEFDWLVQRPSVTIDVTELVESAASRARHVDDAKVAVTFSDDVMGGEPVFAGTQVPIDTILACVSNGISIERIMEAYPFVTLEMVDAAKVFNAIHPGRPPRRRLGDIFPDWIVKETKTFRLPRT